MKDPDAPCFIAVCARCRCNAKTDATRTQLLQTLPPVLFLSLNRFEFDKGTLEREKVRGGRTSRLQQYGISSSPAVAFDGNATSSNLKSG